MLAITAFEPRFVKTVPRELELGVFYVSMEYGTVVHSCCCGCGSEVVTPLTPTDWRLEFDGETISLRPSVGNWNLPCRSHYIVRRNRVIECGAWDEEMIDAARRRDANAKHEFYTEREAPATEPAAPVSFPPTVSVPANRPCKQRRPRWWQW